MSTNKKIYSFALSESSFKGTVFGAHKATIWAHKTAI